jgi:large subunit ribosomal protein L24
VKNSNAHPDSNKLLRNGDEAIVVAGTQKGKRGKIMNIDRKNNKVILQNVNKRKRFQRPSQENPQGGSIEIEMPLPLSNIMFYDAKSKRGTRLGVQEKDGKKIRVSRPGNREV